MTSPNRFVTDLLGETPEDWQREAWDAIEAGESRISIRSGHGVGKTFFLARTASWFITTRHDAKVPIAANTQDQLRDTIWPEFRSIRDKLPDGMAQRFKVAADRVVYGPNFVAGRTVNDSNPEGLQGFHARHLMFLIDEASGLPDLGFEIASGALSTPGAYQVLTGNPTRTTGYFYRTHHSLRDKWWTLRVNSEDYERARGHIEDIISDYGHGSNQYRVRVLGEFPTEDDDTIISLELVESSIDREVGAKQRSIVWGVDIARFGDDRSALAKRHGNRLLEPVTWWHGNDLMQSVGRINREYRETPEADRPVAINVDVIGMGAGVVDRLKELGLPVYGVNVGEKPMDDTGRFLRRNDELWWAARKWFEARDVTMPRDDLLISELTGRRYRTESSGKLRIEPKDEMKKRGLRSPDVADAFILTFAGGDMALGARRPMTAIMEDHRPQRSGRVIQAALE